MPHMTLFRTLIGSRSRWPAELPQGGLHNLLRRRTRRALREVHGRRRRRVDHAHRASIRWTRDVLDQHKIGGQRHPGGPRSRRCSSPTRRAISAARTSTNSRSGCVRSRAARSDENGELRGDQVMSTETDTFENRSSCDHRDVTLEAAEAASSPRPS